MIERSMRLIPALLRMPLPDNFLGKSPQDDYPIGPIQDSVANGSQLYRRTDPTLAIRRQYLVGSYQLARFGALFC